MTVKELRDILSDLPDDLPIATHANGHDYFSGADGVSHGLLRVALCTHYAGKHVLIGNVSKRQLNPPNWSIEKELDGGPQLPEYWIY